MCVYLYDAAVWLSVVKGAERSVHLAIECTLERVPTTRVTLSFDRFSNVKTSRAREAYEIDRDIAF